ncbi:formate dehydrogenase accessory sulfurtransferase FdhD, partial [uncultured Helicobacter sp.]
GRLSMEMVIKAAMSDIPIVVSRAATTHLGIKSAQLLGITLAGFARGETLNIYTHPARIVL